MSKRVIRSDFGTPSIEQVKMWNDRLQRNPWILPDWKTDMIDQIKDAAKKSGMSKVEMQDLCKQTTGISHFEHLDILTDVILQRFLDRLKGYVYEKV